MFGESFWWLQQRTLTEILWFIHLFFRKKEREREKKKIWGTYSLICLHIMDFDELNKRIIKFNFARRNLFLF